MGVMTLREANSVHSPSPVPSQVAASPSASPTAQIANQPASALLEEGQNLPELAVYGYHSFMAKSGMGDEIFPIFEKQAKCKIRPISLSNSGQLLSQLQLDFQRGYGSAQVIVGLDLNMMDKISPYLENWGEWKPKDLEELKEELDPLWKPAKIHQGKFLPYNYGILAFLLDRKTLGEKTKISEPETLKDLLKPEWKRNILLEDPRTSSPGLGFLLYTKAVLGKEVWEFWDQFRSQWLTLAPGWSNAYQLFLKQEAPLVWSYTSSQAYQEENQAPGTPSPTGEKKKRYEALIFDEGQPYQLEGAALLQSGTAEQKRLAKEFLSFLISAEVQSKIPKKVWMLPVRKGVKLPESFAHLPQPKKVLSLPTSGKEVEATLDQWNRTVGK